MQRGQAAQRLWRDLIQACGREASRMERLSNQHKRAYSAVLAFATDVTRVCNRRCKCALSAASANMGLLSVDEACRRLVKRSTDP